MQSAPLATPDPIIAIVSDPLSLPIFNIPLSNTAQSCRPIFDYCASAYDIYYIDYLLSTVDKLFPHSPGYNATPPPPYTTTPSEPTPTDLLLPRCTCMHVIGVIWQILNRLCGFPLENAKKKTYFYIHSMFMLEQFLNVRKILLSTT